MSTLSAEGVGIPHVDVKYAKGLNPQDSLFKIDGQALAQTLTNIGYPTSVLRPIIIEDDPDSMKVAEYNPITRDIEINQRELIREVRNIHREIMQYLGETPQPQTVQDKGILNKLLQSKRFQKLFPTFWPYRMLEDQGRTRFFSGNNERRMKYLNAAREGTLEQDKSLEEQRQRARTHMERLLELALRKDTSFTLAHEYEHKNQFALKQAVKLGLSITPFVTGIALFNALEKILPPSASGDLTALGILAPLGAGIYGMVKGRALEEAKSYEAGFKNMGKFIDCFKIVHEVFAREVLGQRGISTTTTT